MALGVYVYAGYPCLIFRPTGRRDGGNVRVRAFCKLLRLPGKGALFRLSAKLELWIDDVTWQGAWNRKFSRRGELLNVYQVVGLATTSFNDPSRWLGGLF